MNSRPSVLYMICGKIASGKSTLAAQLAKRPGAVIISEDQWLSKLYADDMSSVQHYIEYSARLRSAMGPHIQQLLSEGLSVVMDYPANTIKNRDWMRSIFEGANASHELHYLNVSDDMCKARLKRRNEEGDHQFQVSEEDFHIISSHFAAPTEDEGFNLIVHSADGGDNPAG